MKKILAPGCETPTIAKLMAAARPFAYGMCMAGAGGGGFLYVLTKDNNQKHLLLDILGTVEVNMYSITPLLPTSPKIKFGG
jgi:fucokinase